MTEWLFVIILVCEGHSTLGKLLTCFGEDEGRVTLAARGGLFSRAGLVGGNTLAVTAWFFFPDGSSVAASAGRFMPPIPPTVCRRKGHKVRMKSNQERRRQTRGTHSGFVRGSSCSTARRRSGYSGGREPSWRPCLRRPAEREFPAPPPQLRTPADANEFSYQRKQKQQQEEGVKPNRGSSKKYSTQELTLK